MADRRRRSGHRSERGAAALEFALIAPLLMLLLVGIISYGVMLAARQNLSQAAAEGARAAAVQLDATKRTSSATSAINESLSSVGLTCGSGNLLRGAQDIGDCTIGAATACASGSTDKCVTVKIVYEYRANPIVPSAPLLGAVLPQKLSYSSTIRVS